MVRPSVWLALKARREEERRRARAAAQPPIRSCPIHDSANDAGNSREIFDDDVALSLRGTLPVQVQRIKDRMCASGWCPHQVHHLSRRYDLEVLTYLSTLQRPSGRLSGHQRCSSQTGCFAYNTVAPTYRVGHVTDSCSCSMTGIEYKKLIDVIKQGEIPLVSIESVAFEDHEDYRLAVHARTRSSRYVAISHVWADGLGNPHENALPLCQIRRLKAFLQPLGTVFEGLNVRTTTDLGQWN